MVRPWRRWLVTGTLNWIKLTSSSSLLQSTDIIISLKYWTNITTGASRYYEQTLLRNTNSHAFVRRIFEMESRNHSISAENYQVEGRVIRQKLTKYYSLLNQKKRRAHCVHHYAVKSASTLLRSVDVGGRLSVSLCRRQKSPPRPQMAGAISLSAWNEAYHPQISKPAVGQYT